MINTRMLVILYGGFTTGILMVLSLSLVEKSFGIGQIFRGLLFGFIFGSFLFCLNFCVKKIEKMMRLDYQLTSEQEREFVLSMGQSQSFKRAREVLLNLKVSAKNLKEEEGQIIATTGTAFLWPGEIITVTFSIVDEKQTKINVQSRPALNGLQNDCGKNYENVERFMMGMQNQEIFFETSESRRDEFRD